MAMNPTRILFACALPALLAATLTGCGSTGSPAQPEIPAFASAPVVTYADVQARLARVQSAMSDASTKPISDRLSREEGRPVTFAHNLIKVKLTAAERQLHDKVTTYPLPAGYTGRPVSWANLQQPSASRVHDHMTLIYNATIGSPFPGTLTREEARDRMVVQEVRAGGQPVAYLVRTGFLDPQIAPDPDMYESVYSPDGRLMGARHVAGH